MILSMTGFGKAVKVVNNKKITAEVKSLNSKQLDLSVRVPQGFRSTELELRNMVAHKLNRGKVDLFIFCEPIEGSTSVSVNLSVLKQYKAQLEEVASELGIAQPDDWYATLLRLPDALKNDVNVTEVTDEEVAAVKEAVAEALEALVDFRAQEGVRLDLFFKEKIEAIQQLLNSVDPYEQSRLEKIKARIYESLQKLENVAVDKNRFEQELIFYIEKLDITEEKIRLQNHLNYFLETLADATSQGKKLGFIAQEMGREINTMGSKANQAELQILVVEMKDHLEQIKEQVLNAL
ncbi:MAG: YicC/YloC family endoribonuclease [Bacteroidales bacterium]|nr:YicC/YloC family endoribonuclease [Bacteroidales bacterium]